MPSTTVGTKQQLPPNPFQKAGQQKQSPTSATAKQASGLKPVEEESKHGMKKEDYTKFSKFAKKR